MCILCIRSGHINILGAILVLYSEQKRLYLIQKLSSATLGVILYYVYPYCILYKYMFLFPFSYT